MLITRAPEASIGASSAPRVKAMETMHRPAARVVCLDASDRVLLLRWRDPVDGTWLWEPPGGGIDPGETPLTAARRELVEETGLDPEAVLERSVPVERNVRWKGMQYVGTEDFFVARFTEERPSLERAGLLPDERANLDSHAWVLWSDLDSLPDRVEPPQLLAVLGALVPAGPWRNGGHGCGQVAGTAVST
ncbi:8-oxo-dGTP pyrophosphatase MutT, NUDIX family [Streptomyces sp. cf386]|nr:8-oxo-dGTP pyrophosphatase MutT, NUDIX family [Streptomyces sp. cf386]